MPAPQTRSRSAPAPRVAGFGVFTEPLLFLLHAWLAAIALAAGYVKLAAPVEQVSRLLIWPGLAPEWGVRAAGWLDLAMGAALMLALSSIRMGRWPAAIATAILTLNGLSMLGLYGLERDLGLFLTNLVVVLIGGTALYAHWTYRPRPRRRA